MPGAEDKPATSEDGKASTERSEQDTLLIVSSPVKSHDNVSALIKSDFEKLRQMCSDTKKSISTLAGQPFEALSTSAVSRKTAVTKTVLFEHIKKLLSHCDRMCATDNNTPSYDVQPSTTTVIENNDFKNCISNVEASLVNVDASLSSHNSQLQSISAQLSHLQSNLNNNNISNTAPTLANDIATHPPPPQSLPQQGHPNTPADVKCYEELTEDFLDSDTYGQLSSFLSECSFTSENGHSVIAYGERYRYTGSKGATSSTTALPEILTAVMKSVGDRCKCEVNSVLINHYAAGDESYLPEHSDDESSIDPESVICTLSVGGSRVLTFKEKCSGSDTTLSTVDNSLYFMSRSSQNFFTHRIDKTAGSTDRYSLTFRHLGGKFRRSTIIIGDSNSKNFSFGDGKGTFGKSLPGKRVQASEVKHIRPTDCLSYSNVVIVCGINDLREGQYKRTCDINVSKTFDVLKDKITTISRLKKNINIFISPILPSRSSIYQARAVKFNKLIYSEIIDQNYYKCSILNVTSLCDSTYRTDLLDTSYSRGDQVHLNQSGTRKLAMIIKESIFHKYNSGKGSRIDSRKPYSAALRDGLSGSGTPAPS